MKTVNWSGCASSSRVIEVTHLRKAYGSTVAVEDVSFSIQGTFPPAATLLTLAAYAVILGFLATRYFKWE